MLPVLNPILCRKSSSTLNRLLLNVETFRCYRNDGHQSSAQLVNYQGRPKQYVARFANKLVSNKNKVRVDSLTDQRISPESKGFRTYEPFPFIVTENNKDLVVRRKIEPLHDIPYTDQLSSKESYCRNVLRSLAKELIQTGTPIRIDVRKLPCPVERIVSSPITTSYRNKDEYSIWDGIDGKPTVGYLVFPLGKHGNSISVEPYGCICSKDANKELHKVVQSFIRSRNDIPICKELGKQHGWRRFIIRNNSSDELMLIAIYSPTNIKVKDYKAEIEEFKQYVILKSQEKGLKLKSLYVQPCPYSNCNSDKVPYELLHGDKYLYEQINNFKIRLSPDSFTQLNTTGAEGLYRTIVETVEKLFPVENESDKPLLIDACCGVGLISMHLSKYARKVVGIETCTNAVADAIVNAETNNIKNAKYYAYRVEDVLETVLDKYARFKCDTIVVCNPAQNGMHDEAIRAIRACPEVTKVIYVSCKPDGKAFKNVIDLCKRGPKDDAFTLISATPIDIFPNLEVVELLMVFERRKK